MKNKKTVLVLTSDNNEIFARAIKERLVSEKELLCIIVGENEFGSTGLQIAADLLFNPEGVIRKTAKKLRRVGSGRDIDKISKPELTYKAKDTSYIKMRNVFTRYQPQTVILTSGALLSEVLAVRAKFSPETGIYMLVKDFAVHAGVIHPAVDRYFVENMAVLTMLANLGVEENKIVQTNVPVSSMFDLSQTKAEAAAKLGLDPAKPVALLVNRGEAAESEKRALRELKEYSDGFQIVVYCGLDRGLLEFAQSNHYKAYNEGGNLNDLYSAADLVLTRPRSETVLEALYKQKIPVLLPPESELEKRSLNGLKGLAVDASAKGGLVTFIDDYLRTPGFLSSLEGIKKEAAARLVRPAAGSLIDAIKAILGS